MNVRIHPPFRIVARFKRDDAAFCSTSTHAAELLQAMSTLSDDSPLGAVSAINVGLVDIAVEVVPHEGQPVEEQFRRIAEELGKRGWLSAG